MRIAIYTILKHKIIPMIPFSWEGVSAPLAYKNQQQNTLDGKGLLFELLD